MKVILREDESGVSEVVGTILILAITVVLFSVVILWVSTIPTPVAQSRLDIQSSLAPIYVSGVETKDIINLTHEGGEALNALSTVIYVTDVKPNGATTTDTLHLRLYVFNAALGKGDGLIDGSDTIWNVGERWQYQNEAMRSSDNITVTIVDMTKGLVLWTSPVNPPAGTRPPIFLNTWADRVPSTPTVDTPQSGVPFYVLAQIADPDGDLQPSSAYGTMAYFFGQPSCAQPFRLYDDGINGGHGDQVALDGVFTLYVTACMSNPPLAMDGSIVLFNATDVRGHAASTRMVLSMTQGPGGTGGGGGGAGSGRPPNLRWNGNQGYNIFNGTQWDQLGYSAAETRTFKANETVVLVVASLNLENVFGMNTFSLWDPFSGNPQRAVVYGEAKIVTEASQPSSTEALAFYQFVNGYYIYTYRFKLNDPSVGTNFYTSPPSYPRYYYFARYPVSVLLTSSTNNRFTTTDSINITSASGSQRTFPAIQVFKDSAFSQPSYSFRSTAVVYVQVSMLTVNLNTSMGSVAFGNVILQDFAGGAPVWRAPTGGTGSNPPICPPLTSGACTGQAIWSIQVQNVYRFALNLSRAEQDPWVAGAQSYALSIASVKDSDENYGIVSTQIVVTAPLYKMDVLAGTQEATNNAWGTKNYMFWFQNANGFDTWMPLRVDYCANGGLSISGVAGSGSNCPTTTNVVVTYADINRDGTLDVAQSFIAQQGTPTSMFVIYRRGVDAMGAIGYTPVFFDSTGGTSCTALASGDVTGDGAPEIVCGASNGWSWYYKNDGNWTRVYIDQPSSGSRINSVAIGDFNGDGKNDIALGGNSGYLRWYPNLDGLGRFQNTGVSDNWYAVAEQTVNGTIAANSYLQTYVVDSVYEQVQEVPASVPLETGATTNGGFDSSSNWTNDRISGSGSQTRENSGGNPDEYARVQNNFASNQVVAGYWMQAFTVTGSQPFTASLNLDWRLVSSGATSTRFYAFVDTTSADPPQNPGAGTYVWTSGAQSTPGGWNTVTNISVSTITAPGTYYLKISVHSTYGSSGSTTRGGFDNVVLTWASTPGQTSALEHYWRLNTLPNRPGTAFTFSFRGHVSSSPDGDTFRLHYATNVVGGDPTTGTYTLLTTISSTSDTTVSIPLTPASTFLGATVWIKAVDTNRVIGNTNLDTLSVDQVYISANTPSGATGVTLTNPSDSSAVNSINAGFQDVDQISDLVVGTANGHVFKYLGSVSGLQTPGSCYYSNAGSGSCSSTGTSIVGVKWANMSQSYTGLDIVIAYGTTVRVLSGSGSSGTVIRSNLPSYSPSSSIASLAVGDVNGDGTDDVVIGTSGGGIFLFANMNEGITWTSAVTIYNVGATVYSLVIGDGSNAQYMGR